MSRQGGYGSTRGGAPSREEWHATIRGLQTMSNMEDGQAAMLGRAAITEARNRQASGGGASGARSRRGLYATLIAAVVLCGIAAGLYYVLTSSASSSAASSSSSKSGGSTPSPVAASTPAPVVTATPAPTAKTTPAPVATTTPAPTAKVTPAPTTKTPAPTAKVTPAPSPKTPAPSVKTTPSPVAATTPSPVAATTPSPVAATTPSPVAGSTPAPSTPAPSAPSSVLATPQPSLSPTEFVATSVSYETDFCSLSDWSTVSGTWSSNDCGVLQSDETQPIAMLWEGDEDWTTVLVNATFVADYCYTGGDDDALCADVDASVGIIVRANYGDDDDDGLGQGYYVGLRIWGDKLTIEVRKRERRNSPRAARAPL